MNETYSKSKCVSNESDRKLRNLEAEIVASQHQNNNDVNTRDCAVLKESLKGEAYTQRLSEYALIFPDVGQNRMKTPNSDDSLMSSDSQEINVSKYKEANNKLASQKAELRYFSHTLSQRSTQIEKTREDLKHTKWMQEVEANRTAEAQGALRSADNALEESDKVWKLMDEREVDISKLKDTLVVKESHIDKILAAIKESQTLITSK